MSCFLPDQTLISQVHLRTANLERAVDFYSGILRFQVAARADQRAALSASGQLPEQIVLSEDAKAAPRPDRAIGLYHFAVRLPTRRDLAQAYLRLAKNDYPLDGASDHGVSEAIYLSDPDGNGVELYADRPRSQWSWRDGQVTMVTRGLDLEALVAETGEQGLEAGGQSGLAPQTDIGHIHLHVADLAAAERFYHDYLGLSVTQRSYPGALFFAAGGYHHHFGVNTWAGRAVAPGAVGLVSYRLQVPEAEIIYCLGHRAPLLGYESRLEASENAPGLLQIRDPNGTWLEIESSKALHGCGSIVPRMKRHLRTAASFLREPSESLEEA